MPRFHFRHLAVACVALTMGASLTACGESEETKPEVKNSTPIGSTVVPQQTATAMSLSVKAGDDSCILSTDTLQAGSRKITVTNVGKVVTEVYVYGGGDKVIGEVENVGPGTSRDFTVEVSAGQYEVACKPGQKGSGIRAPLAVAPAA